MIDINLVPSHLRKKRKGKLFAGRVSIPLEIIIGCGGGLLLLLGMIHVLLLFVNVRKLAQHNGLQKQWEALRPDKENVDFVVSEIRAVQSRYKAIENIVGKGELNWAQKLNLLSDNLPRGMWFERIALSENVFFLEGSAISRETNEIINVHRLTSDLKKNDEFMRHFVGLEIGSIQRRKIRNIEVADFVITTKLK